MYLDSRPTLETDRLLLRPFSVGDARDVQRLAGDRAIADTTLGIPHPYVDGVAETWIGTHVERFARRQEVVFAVTLAATGELIGGIGLNCSPEHRLAEIGYWICRDEWRRGYATEAATATLDFGFGKFNLERIFGRSFVRNPASARVLEKIGMTYEGTLRQHVLKFGVREDVLCYGLLRGDRPTAREPNLQY